MDCMDFSVKTEYVTIDNVRLLKYVLPDGDVILVGRSDEDNDRLSLHIAHPEDYWFHVKSLPGSHVVLQHRRDEPSKRVLEATASIAAFHSKAKNAGRVPVHYTMAKYVSKPRRAKPGTVMIKNERTLKVKPFTMPNSCC